MKERELVLYQYDMCPFCMRVRHFLSVNNVDIPMKDTLMDPVARQELMEAGGKTQVPALMIDGEVMYESDDIIRWVQTNLL
ncbi:glutaredoxin [Chloroflexi bacterium TSY]|nr:glutaredoxin [Chloroflexi bacterium TSY]